MRRGTLGTGMMAPLALANNFNGPYYAGPSGLAIGALSAANSIAEGLRDFGAAKGERAERERVQGEKDRVRMEDLNQRQAVASALNPMQAAQSSGMGNRDMSQRMALPDVQTQTAIYGLQEKKRLQEQARQEQGLASLATHWYLNGGPQADPDGSKFKEKTGSSRSPFELIPESVINADENRKNRLQIAKDANDTRTTLASLVASTRGGDKPKRELFTDESGQYFWLNEGDPIPRGYSPAKSGGININTGALPTEKAKMVTLADDGSNSYDVIMSTLFDPVTGELDRQTAALVRMPGAREGLFGQKVSQARAALDNSVRAKLRLESGAAIGDKEQAAEDAKYIPGINDDTETARSKLVPLGQILKAYKKNSTGKDGEKAAPATGVEVPEGYHLVNP